MSAPIRHIVRQAAQKAASDPAVREKAVEVASTVVEEAKKIAKEEDRAYAAGKALRRAFNKWQSGR